MSVRNEMRGASDATHVFASRPKTRRGVLRPAARASTTALEWTATTASVTPTVASFCLKCCCEEEENKMNQRTTC